MLLSIRTNITAIAAQRNLSSLMGSFDSSLKRLSSGLRINSAADDAAGLQIGVVDQIRRWMAVPQPVDTTQFTGWRTGIPSPISLFITFTPAR
ncbi:hypothetical protein ACET9V_03675, partial [Aeromonas caviae]